LARPSTVSATELKLSNGHTIAAFQFAADTSTVLKENDNSSEKNHY
jgi:hypothetical protein